MMTPHGMNAIMKIKDVEFVECIPRTILVYKCSQCTLNIAIRHKHKDSYGQKPDLVSRSYPRINIVTRWNKNNLSEAHMWEILTRCFLDLYKQLVRTIMYKRETGGRMKIGRYLKIEVDK